jgi:transcriptional regulator with XRE-family HTH domain
MRVGRRIRTQRQALKLTQQELAHELGVTHQHVSRIEGEQAAPSLELVVKLSRRLGVTADYLLTGEKEPAFDATGGVRREPRLSAAAKRHLIGLIEELRR